MEDIKSLGRLIQNSRQIVFFGGAGVSTQSGIPDFRSAGGLFETYGAKSPETILSHSFFVSHAAAFFDFYQKHMLYLDAKPNAAHHLLARLEADGRLLGVITQNIDGLHQQAGSQKVIELHGSVYRNYCQRCSAPYTARFMLETSGVPRCTCGGVIKPDVVLYGESLSARAMDQAKQWMDACDLLIVGGTSLVVQPAAWFAMQHKGPLALVNQSQTPLDERADIVLRQPIAKVFAALEQMLYQEGG